MIFPTIWVDISTWFLPFTHGKPQKSSSTSWGDLEAAADAERKPRYGSLSCCHHPKNQDCLRTERTT